MTVGSNQPVSRAVAGSAAGSAGRAPRVDTGCLLLCSTATATPGGNPVVGRCGPGGPPASCAWTVRLPPVPGVPPGLQNAGATGAFDGRPGAGLRGWTVMSEPLPAPRVPALVDRPFTRRSLLVAALAGTALAVAGCTGSDRDDADAVTPEQVDQLAAQVQVQ